MNPDQLPTLREEDEWPIYDPDHQGDDRYWGTMHKLNPGQAWSNKVFDKRKTSNPGSFESSGSVFDDDPPHMTTGDLVRFPKGMGIPEYGLGLITAYDSFTVEVMDDTGASRQFLPNDLEVINE